MAEMEHYPNFQKDNYIHPKAAWDKLRMAGARRQNVYLYAATGYGKTELSTAICGGAGISGSAARA